MPFIPPLFSKFGKEAADNLKEEDYELGRVVSMTTHSKTGLVSIASISQRTPGDAVLGIFKAQHKCEKHGDWEFEANTAHLVKTKYESPEITKGVKVEVEGNHDRKDGVLDCNISVEPQYSRDNMTAALVVNLKNSKVAGRSAEAEFGAHASIGAEGASFGGGICFDGSHVSDYGVGFDYKKSHHDFAIKTQDKISAVKFSAVIKLNKFKLSESLSVAFKEMAWEHKVGVEYHKEATTWKGMLSHCRGGDAMASVLHSSQFNAACKLSLSGTVNLKDWHQHPRVGTKFEIGDV